MTTGPTTFELGIEELSEEVALSLPIATRGRVGLILRHEAARLRQRAASGWYGIVWVGPPTPTTTGHSMSLQWPVGDCC